MTRKAKLISYAVVLGLVFCGAGYWYWQKVSNEPPKAAVLEAVQGQIRSVSGLQIDKVSTHFLSGNPDSGVEMTFSAKVKATDTFYNEVSLADALTRCGGDPEAFHKMVLLLSQRNGARLMELAGISDTVDILKGARFLIQSAKIGDSYELSGKLKARRTDKKTGKWIVRLSGVSSPDCFTGRVKSFWPSDVLIVLDDADGKARMEKSVAASKTLLPDLEKAQVKLQEILAQELDKRINEQFSPGVLYTGAVVRSDHSKTALLYLEMLSLNKEHRTFVAQIRNDGGWEDARKFQGTYNCDKETGEFTVSLSSTNSQRVEDCGPVLDWSDYSFDISLSQSGDNSYAGECGNWKFTFELVPAEKQAEVIEHARENERRLKDAVSLGKVYLLTATDVQKGISFENFVTVTKNERDGTLLEVTYEDITNDTRRVFRGSIITNAYRADGKPLRLRSGHGDHDERAGDDTLIGFNGQVSIRASFDDGKFTESDDFLETYVPTTMEVFERRKREELAARETVVAMFKAGDRFEGLATSSDRSYAGRECIRILRVSNKGAVCDIRGSLESMDEGGVKRPFRATLDTIARKLHVSVPSDSGVIRRNNDTLREPWFVYSSSSQFTFDVDVEARSLESQNNNWTLVFKKVSASANPSVEQNSSAGVRSSTESPDKVEIPHTVIPSLPKGRGGYVLRDGKWVRLDAGEMSFVGRNSGEVRADIEQWPGDPVLTGSFSITRRRALIVLKDPFGNEITSDWEWSRAAKPVAFVYKGTRDVGNLAQFGGMPDPHGYIVKLDVHDDKSCELKTYQHTDSNDNKLYFEEQLIESTVEEVEGGVYVFRTAPLLPGTYALLTPTDTYVFRMK